MIEPARPSSGERGGGQMLYHARRFGLSLCGVRYNRTDVLAKAGWRAVICAF